ncbi:unnamed protein product [Discula destructiva]
MKTTLNSCLLACLIHSALALPLAPREAGNKNLLLWDYTNTNAATANANFKVAIDTAAPKVKAVSNWNTWRPTEAPTDLAFYPTVRTMEQLSGNDWSMLISSIETEKAAGRTPIVQFLNEPEYLGVSADSAAGAWRNSILPLRQQYGAKLVGPATSSSDSGIAFQDAFMALLADTEKPDYVGVHYYTTQDQAVADSVSWGQNYLNSAHAKYGLPLMVNEIASVNRDAGLVKEFSDTFKSWMDSQDWIAEYGFFGATPQVVNDFVSPAAQLLDVNGAWTSLGKDLMNIA